ncbi:AMP-binding protein [Streptomyces noursei]|uniref:AMP-binding protein n=1 Tax=Streptomyces noursei TaxID=1971 RepID=UPI00382B4404
MGAAAHGNRQVGAWCEGDVQGVEGLAELLVRVGHGVPDGTPSGGSGEGRDATTGTFRSVLLVVHASDGPARPGTASDAWTGVGVEPTDANTAYLLYTSGTTGRPKGVCVTRGALAAHVDDMAERLELVPEDRVLWFAAPHVDVAWEQALTPLRVGATVVTRGPGVPTFGELADLVERHAVTVANLPGGYWNGWALALTEQQRTQRRALRLMISGSERMSARAAVNWQRILPDVPLLNAYGPTEAVITSTLFRVPAGLAARDEIPIGTACGSRQLQVLNAELAPVVRGQVGELYVGGGPLAREYLGRPSMTAARFVPDPYADSRGAVMYRTGDLVRENADGDLEFVGRIDDQVKVRGFRVEPAEVRLALERHPAVRHCAVLGRTAPGGPTSLVADPAFWAGDDSLPILRELRQRAPLWHLESATEGPLWCVLSHELAGEVLGDAARFSSERGSLLGTGRDRAPAGAGKMMALTDPPPRHRHLRNLVLPYSGSTPSTCGCTPARGAADAPVPGRGLPAGTPGQPPAGSQMRR